MLCKKKKNKKKKGKKKETQREPKRMGGEGGSAAERKKEPLRGAGAKEEQRGKGCGVGEAPSTPFPFPFPSLSPRRARPSTEQGFPLQNPKGTGGTRSRLAALLFLALSHPKPEAAPPVSPPAPPLGEQNQAVPSPFLFFFPLALGAKFPICQFNSLIDGKEQEKMARHSWLPKLALAGDRQPRW